MVGAQADPVIVTGCAGFIGSQVCTRLLAEGREVIGIDCQSLIEQGGSLHCITMQLPRGVAIPGGAGR